MNWFYLITMFTPYSKTQKKEILAPIDPKVTFLNPQPIHSDDKPQRPNPHGLLNLFPVQNSQHILHPPIFATQQQGKSFQTKIITLLPIEKIEEHRPDSYKEFRSIKYIEGPTYCSSMNVKAFAHLLREGLTTGMSNRVYLQKGYHKIWVPVTYLQVPNTPLKLSVNFMYNNTLLKNWEFPIVTSDAGFGSQVDLDLLTEKFFLQKRLYRMEFMCEDMKVVTPEFSIVNLQQFTKTKKKKVYGNKMDICRCTS